MTLCEGLLCLWGSAPGVSVPYPSGVSPAAPTALYLPRETRATLGVVFHVSWCQHSGPEEALTVLVASAYLITSFGELLCRAGHTAVVVVFGAVSTGLAREAGDKRTHST